jgi:hypothetical protein
MRIISGAIVVLGGAILWGMGAVADSLEQGASSFHDKGTIAIVVAAVLVFIGIGTMAVGLTRAD